MSHGVTRKRESPEKEAARREKERSEVNEYRKLTEEVMSRVLPIVCSAKLRQRTQRDFSKDLTTTLLKKNPEFYMIWNYRRQILLNGLFKEYVVLTWSCLI